MDEERTLVTDAVNQEEGRRKTSSMYPKPTTMRGIPLVSLTSSPLIRGFYITRSDDLSSSTFVDDFTSSYTTIDSSIERQTETALIPDLISTTDETITVTHNNQNDIETDEVVAVTRNNQKELELDTFDDNVNDIAKSKGVDNRAEKSPTFDSFSDRTENLSTYTEPTTPVIRSTHKRKTLLRNFDSNTTPLSNVYAVSPTSSTRQRFTLGVIRQPHYNEASIPLWTGKRIVARKRNFSSIKEAERRIDEDVSHTTTNIFKNASAIFEIPSTSAKRKPTSISTTPTIPLIVSESKSSETLVVYSDSTAYSVDESKTESSKNRTNAEEAIASTNSIIASTPSISKVASITSDSTAAIISTISDDFTSVTAMPSTANEAIITTTPSSTNAVVKAPMIASDQAAITIESVTKSAEIEFPVSMTAHYSAADVPITASTHAIANDSVIIPVTTSIGVEITSPNANHSTDFANMIAPATMSAEVQMTSAITNYSVTAPTNTDAIVTDSTPVITISARNEIIPTVADSVVATQSPATQEVATDPTTTTSAARSTEVETSFTITNHPALVIPATMIPATNTSSSTIISSTHATVPATTNKLADIDTVTLTNMLTTTIPPTVIVPTINDSNVITPADMNISSNLTITDTLTTASRPKNISVISSEDFVTSVDTTSTSSAVPTTLTIESTTTHFHPSDFNVSISRSLPSTNSVTSSQISENSVTSMIAPSTLFSITTPINDIVAVEKSTLSAIDDESIATNIIQTTSTYKPSSVQMTSEESTTSRMKTAFEEGASRAISRKQEQTRSEPDDQIGQKSSRRRVVNRTNIIETTSTHKPSSVQMTSEESTTLKMKTAFEEGASRAVSRKQNQTRSEPDNQIGQKSSRRRVVNRTNIVETTSTYKLSSVQMTSEESTTSKMKATSEKGASRAISRKQDQSRSEPDDQIGQKSSRRRVVNRTNIVETTSTHKPSSVQMTSEESTTLKMKTAFEEDASRAISRKQDQTRSEPDDQIGQKNYRRRVVNRKNNWLGRPAVQHIVNQYPLHRVTLHRGRSRRPSGNNSRVIKQNHRKNIIQKSVNLQPISSTIKPDEDIIQNTTENHIVYTRAKNVQRRIVSKRFRERVLDKETTTLQATLLSQSNGGKNETLHGKEARANPDFVDINFQGNFSINFDSNQNFSNKGNRGRRMRVLLRNIRPKSEENNSTIEETNTNIDENLQNNLSSNLSTSGNLADERKTRRRMRIVLRKKIRSKFEEEEAKTGEASENSDSTDESLRGAFSSDLRRGKNFPDYKPRRRLKVLKSIKPKSAEENSTAKETSVDFDSTDKDLQGSFSSNLHTNINLFNEKETRRSIKSVSEEKDSIAEETITHSNFTDKDISSNLQIGDNPFDREKMMTHFKDGKKETVERLEDTEELQTTETFVLVKEDTDQPSLEVNSLRNGGSIGRTTGYSNRYRKPTQSTTNVPLINTFPSTVAIYRRGRPIETTFSSRIDLIDAYEDSSSPATQNDQKADVSDQSIRAQEFAVTLTDPPLSSSDSGRTLLTDAARRKISTTVAPRTDPAIDRTVISRYDAGSRNRQRPKTKSARPTVNATTRPRRPPVLDYDYYEDETPIAIDKPFLNSKLFLTSKGTIRCLDQGNFPHPYSCKKFITCARMVNGQVIGTEYTCPDRLTFDPIGGICNWSAGLGCKD